MRRAPARRALRARPPRRALRLPTTVAAALLAVLALLPAAAHAQTLRPEVVVTSGAVYATALSAIGATLYLGGSFSYVGPNTGPGVRLSPAGGTVLPGGLVIDGAVRVSVADGAGGFYVGGDFTQVGGTVRNRLARILADGSLDPAFNPNVTGSFASVRALALDDGVLFAGGDFTSVAGQSRSNLAAIDAQTGTVTAFAPSVSGGSILALVVRGGVVYAGGSSRGSAGKRAPTSRPSMRRRER